MNQTTSNLVSDPTAAIAFIEAGWHADVVGRCRKGFLGELERRGWNPAAVEFFRVPGSLEIPLLAKKLAEIGRHQAIVAAGLIVDGGIYRHDFVAATVLDGMMRVQLDSGVPVLSAVLTPQQFREEEPHLGFFRDHFVIKGKEVASACIDMR